MVDTLKPRRDARLKCVIRLTVYVITKNNPQLLVLTNRADRNTEEFVKERSNRITRTKV